jgi:hypothetical protein
MSTKTHDDLIKMALRWAETLGYTIVEKHLGTDTGADAIFENQFQERVLLEVVTGGRFKSLFDKKRIRDIFEIEEQYFPTSFLGLIVVGDRINNIKKHAANAEISKDFFEPPDQKIFPVLAMDFKEIIPALLIKLLGSKASAYGRWTEEVRN